MRERMREREASIGVGRKRAEREDGSKKASRDKCGRQSKTSVNTQRKQRHISKKIHAYIELVHATLADIEIELEEQVGRKRGRVLHGRCRRG